ATLPSSVAAFHLAVGPDDVLYVTAPTLSPHDAVHRIDRDGPVRVLETSFGRPQALAFDSSGPLFVGGAQAGARSRYTPRAGGAEVVGGGVGLGGVGCGGGGVVVCSNDTAYRLPLRA